MFDKKVAIVGENKGQQFFFKKDSNWLVCHGRQTSDSMRKCQLSQSI